MRDKLAAWGRRFTLTLRGDWLFLLLLVVAVVMRALVTIAFRPGRELFGDSYAYVNSAAHLFDGGRLHLGSFHPDGYPLFLSALWWTHYTLAVVSVQHLLGLLAGVATYFAVRRLVTRPWLAALAAAPVLLDGYQLDIEQFLLSDTLFLFLVLIACLLVLVPRQPSTAVCGIAGLLIAAATLTRGLGLAVLLPLGVYAVARRLGWRRLVALGACALLPVVAYMVQFHQSRGKYALEATDGLWLYGRTAYFADCSKLPPVQQTICPDVPVSQRLSPEVYTWSKYDSPLYLRYGRARRPIEGKRFAYAVIRSQPLGFLRTTVDGMLRDMSPVRHDVKWAWSVPAWQMSPVIHPSATNTPLASETLKGSAATKYPLAVTQKAAFPARFTELYQKVVWTWGPTLAVALLAVLVAVVRRTRKQRQVWVAAALAASGLLLMLIPAMTVVQDYRYMLPVQAMLWPAAALAVDALLADRRSSTREP